MLSLAPAPFTSPARLARPYVLIVDDHLPSLTRLHDLVATAGHSCRMASSAPEALRQCDRVVPRLVVTDLDMPNLDGQGLALWLRARYPSVPLVLMTGEDLDRRATEAMRLTFTAIISKPLDIDGFLGVIDRLMPVVGVFDPLDLDPVT
jgi:DNA-binding NtrC family response regulator